MIEKIDISRISNGKVSKETDIVAKEVKITIRCNSYELETFASPDMYEELAIGNIASASLIHSYEDINSIYVKKNQNNIVIDIKINDVISPLSKKIIENKKDPDYNIIDKITKKVIKNAKFFDMTGAFHYAYLFDTYGDLKYSACDIGRFNAIDKVCGSALKSQKSLSNYILFTTGRIVGRTVDKADALNIHTIVSKAPALYESIVKAHNNNISIIGFSRNSQYILY